MLKVSFVLLAFLVSSSAIAQAPELPSAREQALTNRLLREMSEAISCDTARVNLQTELAKAQARIHELEAKDKFEKPTPPPPGK